MKIKHDYNLLSLNTFGISAKCNTLIEYNTPDELLSVIGQSPVLHIGGGSNLLFLDDYKGTILHSRITTIEELEDCRLRVGAGVIWDELVDYTIQHNMYGLENLSLIPGEVGASAVQNIGAYGSEAKDFIVEVDCMNLVSGERRIFSNEECRYGYRQSIFKTDEYKGKWAVLYVTYQLYDTFTPRLDYGGIRVELERKGIGTDTLTAQQLRDIVIEIRHSKLPDPKVLGNAGSFFMNPVVSREKYEELAQQYTHMPHYDVDAEHVKIPAGWMIEQCGWKGRSLGKAAVHDRQALVLVNLGGASGEDILKLCNAVRADVNKRFGIDIHPEVNFI